VRQHRVKTVLATVASSCCRSWASAISRAVLPALRTAQLFLQLRLPEGTAFNVTEKYRGEGETAAQGRQGHRDYTAYVGQGSPPFWLGLNPQLPNEAFARS